MGFFDIVDKKTREKTTLETNKEKHRGNLEAFGQLFREHASELDDLGRFRHIVPLTNKGSLGQIVEVVCEAEDDLINIELSTKIKDTYYTLATMSINTNEPDLDSMTMYNHIADFSPKYLQVTLDDMIRSKKPYELRNALHEANQTSITEFHYSPTLIENSYTMSEHGLRETGRERFTVGIKNGRMVMQPYDEFDNVDYLKNSNGEIIVFNDLDDAVTAAVTVAPYADLMRQLQTCNVEKPDDVITVKSLTDVGDMISQCLEVDHEFSNALSDLNEDNLQQ